MGPENDIDKRREKEGRGCIYTPDSNWTRKGDWMTPVRTESLKKKGDIEVSFHLCSYFLSC